MSNLEINGKLNTSLVGNNTILAITSIIFPIGAYYITENASFNPNGLFTGKWEKINGGYTLLSSNGNNTDSSSTNASNHSLGSYYAGGLPNILGSFDPWAWKDESNFDRAFYKVGTGYDSFQASGNSNGYRVGFDASRSNDIYGTYQSNKSCVIPDHISVIIWRRTS